MSNAFLAFVVLLIKLQLVLGFRGPLLIVGLLGVKFLGVKFLGMMKEGPVVLGQVESATKILLPKYLLLLGDEVFIPGVVGVEERHWMKVNFVKDTENTTI